jgi:PAS domain-containing protein
MRLRRDLWLGIGVLVAFLLAVSFGSIGLMGRMSPVIELILRENVVSLAAVEEMLASLALAQGSEAEPAGALVRRFDAALEQARANVTEPGEPPVLAAVADGREAALAGDPESLRQVAEALVDLGGINRAAMRRMDENAKRLGNAGAWAVVFLALCALGLSVAVVGRLRRRVVEPLERIHAAVIDEHRERRCHVAGGSRELTRIGKEIDRLLDDFERIDRSTRIPIGGPERPLLLALLETRGQPVVIADGAGRPIAANRAAQELLLGEDGPRLRGMLEEPAAGGPGSSRWSSAALGYEGYRLCTLEPAPGEAEEGW